MPKVIKPKLPSEHQEQKAFVQWFNAQYPKYRGCLFAIPNGSHLAGTPAVRAMKMNKLKSEGFKNGVSDLFLAVPMGGKSGMFLEMKAQKKPRSSLSVEQRMHLKLMEEMGYAACWAAGSKEAIRITKDYMDGIAL